VPTAKTEQIKLDPIRSRGRARAGVGLVVLLVVGFGIWGAVRSVEGVRAYRQAQRVESAIEQARYALVLERSSLADRNPVRGRREFSTAAAGFATDVKLLARSGRSGDVALAGGLGAANRRIAAAAREGFSARLGDPEASDTIFRDTVDPGTRKLDRVLAQAFDEVRATGADGWPTRSGQRLELGAAGLLVALGLASAAVYLLRLAGYRRRVGRVRRAQFAWLVQAAV
jgi:hypothetical protein